MADMDPFTRFQLEERRRERDQVRAAEKEFVAQRAKVQKETVETIRESHDRGFSDQQIANVLGMSRNAVNQLRLHGKMESNFGARKK